LYLKPVNVYISPAFLSRLVEVRGRRTSRRRNESRRPGVVVVAAVAGAVAGAIATAPVTIYVAHRTGDAQMRVQETAYQQRREDEARLRRTEAYSTFLIVTQDAEQAIYDAVQCFMHVDFSDRGLTPPEPIAEMIRDRCSGETDAANNKTNGLDPYLEGVLVYGSDTAYAYARTIVRVLQTHPLHDVLFDHEPEYRPAVSAFYHTMCIEISPVNRDDCSEPDFREPGSYFRETGTG
jgi:hypothetical protein